MKGLFIPEVTAEMFRNGCLESIETLMAEGEIYDIDYPLEQEPKTDGDCISRQSYDKGFDDGLEEGLKVGACEDCISRQEAIRAIEALQRPIMREVSDYYQFKFSGMSEAREAVVNLPPVTPAEKVGHWEWVQHDGNPNIGSWHCSECRTIIPFMPEETDNTPIYKWCPMCGCRMQEVSE